MADEKLKALVDWVRGKPEYYNKIEAEGLELLREEEAELADKGLLDKVDEFLEEKSGKLAEDETLGPDDVEAAIEEAVEKLPESSSKVISEADRIKIDGWEYPPDDELYLKYKDVFDNPKYYDQTTGEIHWPGQNGDIHTDGFLNGQYMDTNLQSGKVIDRFGGNNGTFFAEDGTAIEKRAMAPNSDFSVYNRYEVKKEIPAREGEIAPWFDQPGGGIQYQLNPEFVTQIRNNLRTGETLIDGLIRLGYLKKL